MYHYDLAKVIDAARIVDQIDSDTVAAHRTTREWLGVGLVRTGMRLLGRITDA